MKGWSLGLFNVAGVLFLGVMLIVQWRRERELDWRVQDLKVRLVAAQDQAVAEGERARILTEGQGVLKESISSLQQAAETSGRELAERSSRVTELEEQVKRLTEREAVLADQIKAWEAAVGQRDEKIRSLGADLTSTRKRLDEAIARLKAGR